jgi:hypothetical protein
MKERNGLVKIHAKRNNRHIIVHEKKKKKKERDKR